MNIVSLFAGCGGLDLGFEKAGFNVVWANEFDKTIQDTYKLNHPNTILNTNDIRMLTGADIPDCDGIIGGPPCQAWSEGGKRLGIKDPRGQLFIDYIRIVRDKKPKFFLIENVQGILDEIHKGSLSEFIQMLQDAGYNITYKLLNASDYNVPQDRFRVFFIGIRKDLTNKFVFPAPVGKRISLRQAIGDITEIPRFFNGAVTDENYSRSNHDVYSGAYDAKYMSRNRVRGWDETSFAMQAQARNAPQHPQAPKMTFISSSKRIFAQGYEHLYRRLSVRECARIQTFPDNYKFIYNDIKDGYKMVGNAVPPRLAWYIANQMMNAFKNECKNSFTNSSLALSVESNIELNSEKRVIIGLVKPCLEECFINHSANYYYTKKLPSTVHIDELYYFMPYIKQKGIRDLYEIKGIHIGSKLKVDSECDDNSTRLIFELKFVKQLFNDYKPCKLNIWYTFTDISLIELLQIGN